MNVRNRVELSQVERTELKALLSGGKHASRKLKRAQILLAAEADAGAASRSGAQTLSVATACQRPKGPCPLGARAAGRCVVKLTDHNSLTHETATPGGKMTPSRGAIDMW